MKNNLLLLVFFFSINLFSQSDNISVYKDDNGMKLVVNGDDFLINGMNWDYVPIGTNYSYDFWSNSDDFIKNALESEMGLLKNMGVNTIRVYKGIPPKWVKHIYETYGIYTMLNHSFGRYGLTINGVWTPVTDYRDPATKELLLNEVKEMVEEFKGTPGLLLFLLGNENNYGLFWQGAETEDFPDDADTQRLMGEKRGRPMYKLFNEAALLMKSIDNNHPVAICNGDLLFADMVADECPDVDIYGTNMYRGKSFGDAFERVKKELNKPIMFTEFGADSFNALKNEEDQRMQAFFNLENWKEIYQNAYGLGKAGNSIGGFTFQFSDGWWKVGQTKNLDVHDNDATWTNGGYYLDTKDESKNMNEEWFGICAKGQTNSLGYYTLYPRAAYYALKEAHSFNPFALGVNSSSVENHFKNIQITDAVLRARADKAALGDNQILKISNLRAEFTTFHTGGSLITTPDISDPDSNVYPNRLGFDHMQSYYVGVKGQPTANMMAEVNFNILGNVAGNPIDDIFYENVGRPVEVSSPEGDITLTDNNRLRVYNASFEWKAKDFDMRGFYRTGHYHWGYEGDFFGLYPESYYGPNLDIYNGEILGMEIDAKGSLDGLKAAFGPQLWWGANPAVLLKYEKTIGHYNVAAIYHKDIVAGNGIDENGNRVLDPDQVRSGVIPALPTERASIAIEREISKFGFTLGAIYAGRPLNGRAYQVTTGNSGNYQIFNDKIQSKDNWGAKAKVTYTNGGFNMYAQGSVRGLVANGGADQTLTFTGWKLKDSGSGNVNNFLTGIAYNFGSKFQIAPNFMWQKPLVDPMPNDVQAPGRLRNWVDDPFSVRAGNREMTAGEILFTYDPTPATYMYEFDNDRAEDAKFAFNLGFVFRHLPTTQDAAIGFLEDRSFFAFTKSAPAQDLWEVNSRVVSKLNSNFGLITNLYYGTGQANGDSERLIKRFGADLRLIYNKMKVTGMVKVNDWGPFDYHRDFNLTFPLQLMLDFSTSIGKPNWIISPDTKVGIRGTWRSLNEFSPRYSPNETSTSFATQPTISPVGFPNGSEWEVRTYIHINIGK